MTLDEIMIVLNTSDAVLKDALTAGVACAAELAPPVFAVADKFCRGVYLLPSETDSLFYGLHILAAARHPGLCDRVLAIARQPGEDVDRLFPRLRHERLVAPAAERLGR